MWYPRTQETLPKMLGSIRHDYTVYPDGVDFPYRFKSKTLGDNAGCFRHYYRVLEDLCQSNAEYVTVLPDDVVFKRGWLKTALSVFHEKTGFVALYVPNGVKHRFGWKKGWYELKGGWDTAYGGGYIFKRETAIKILEHPFFIEHRDNYEKNQQIDHAVPEVVHRLGLKQMFYLPSLIKHIGKTSTIGHVHTQSEDVGW